MSEPRADADSAGDTERAESFAHPNDSLRFAENGESAEDRVARLMRDLEWAISEALAARDRKLANSNPVVCPTCDEGGA